VAKSMVDVSLYSPCGPWSLFQFLNLYTVGRTPWTGDQPVARPLPTQIQNKGTQTSMPLVGFETTVLVFERAKMVHALDRAATVIGLMVDQEVKTFLFLSGATPLDCILSQFNSVRAVTTY
jgi:hypothetical protein